LETGGLPLNLLPYGFAPHGDLHAVSLLHLTVPGVLPARIAELFGLHPVGMLLLILRRRIIPIFAIVALQRDDFSHGQSISAVTR
jgi:hypothetical protein